MLMHADRSTLLMIDVQERLFPHMQDAAPILENCVWLARVARRLHVPIVVTEQYPQGLGPTVPQLREALGDAPVVTKMHFSAALEPDLMQQPALVRPQIVVAGMETHVCVLQTACVLQASGKQVFVVADAVSSRTTANRDLGIARMRAAGISIVSREMVAFEWLERAGTPLFREVSREFLR